jgi:predicted GIY-YIG superfamily endonuclease
MFHVYLIRSEFDPQQKYIGVTTDLKERLGAHNRGESSHTSKFKPWVLVAYFSFADKDRAYDFEKYLKTHSGRAFANKRFW